PLLCSSALRLPPSSTLFPYTTLFRSRLGHDVHGPAQRPCLLAHRRRDLGEDVRRAGVEDRVDGVEPEPVDVALAHPGARVLDEVAPYALGLWAVEVDRAAPRCAVAVGEVGPELAEVGSIGAEMV